MADNMYDAIVVGARCAGAPAAMLLARKGYKVLVVDRATFPSDTVSTHLLQPEAVAALKRWGLLDRVVETGVPPIHTYSFDFGPFVLRGSPAIDGVPATYAPRRTVLDKILVDAAREAGAEVREGFSVQDVLFEDGTVTGIAGHGQGGSTITEKARVVIGADGLRSKVAAAVRPEQYNEKPALLCGYYSYWSGLPMNGVSETHVLPNRGFAAWPTNDGLTLIICGWPQREFEANRDDIEGNVMKTLAMVPEFSARLAMAKREERFAGMFVPNYFRKPYGPGWALVGDAGYNKDFITAQGIQDAFRDAELCVNAVDEAFTGKRHFYAAMAEYQSRRDQHVAGTYELTTMLATIEPPPPPMAAILAAAAGNQEAMDAFMRVAAGVAPPSSFFSPASAETSVAAAAG
jgi:2-polyprenyl-6-methoxyphenol hydroxylase-like FAD-dependent oxidoreductase